MEIVCRCLPSYTMYLRLRGLYRALNILPQSKGEANQAHKDYELLGLTGDSKKLEQRRRMICAGFPFFGLGLEDVHVATFWFLVNSSIAWRLTHRVLTT